MLVLGRKVGEMIVIGDGSEAITVLVTEIKEGQVKLGFRAPRRVGIFRSELVVGDRKDGKSE